MGRPGKTHSPACRNALQTAEPDEALYVAAGVYYPDEGAAVVDNDRLATFQLKSGVTLLGGFPGGGGDLEERNPANYLTWLSGDIDQNDGPDFENISGNSFIVVNASEVDGTAILDGFVITAGNANGSGPLQTRGGGLSIQNNGSPIVRNCVFQENSGSIGNAFYSSMDSLPIVENCLFIGNSATFGGAMYNSVSSSPGLTNCAFQGNHARLDGGAIYNDLNASPTIHNSTFSGNRADRRGGAIYNTRASLPVLC